MRVIFKQLVNGHDLHDKGRELIKNRDVVRDLDFLFQRILIFLISPTYQFEEMCKNNDLGPLLCSRVAEFRATGGEESKAGDHAVFLTDLKDANFMVDEKKKAWLVDFEIYESNMQHMARMDRAMYFAEGKSQLYWLHGGRTILGKLLHFHDYFECPTQCGRDLSCEGSKGCFNFGMHVLYERQKSLGFSNIKIKKLPVQRETVAVSMGIKKMGKSKNRLLSLELLDVHFASLKYYKDKGVDPEEKKESEQGQLSLYCGKCSVHLPYLNEINKHHITVNNNRRGRKYRSFTFDVEDFRDRMRVYSQLRLACCQSNDVMASGILTIGKRKHYFEKYHSMDRNMDVIFYGPIHGLMSKEFRGFTNSIELNENEWVLGRCGDRVYTPKTKRRVEKSLFNTRLAPMDPLQSFSLDCREIREMPRSETRPMIRKRNAMRLEPPMALAATTSGATSGVDLATHDEIPAAATSP